MRINIAAVVLCALSVAFAREFRLPEPGADGKIAIFNGKDLTGWEGDPKIWSVKDGAIVGKHEGLAHNDFLKSKFEVADFRLVLQVKLVDNNRVSKPKAWRA